MSWSDISFVLIAVTAGWALPVGVYYLARRALVTQARSEYRHEQDAADLRSWLDGDASAVIFGAAPVEDRCESFITPSIHCRCWYCRNARVQRALYSLRLPEWREGVANRGEGLVPGSAQARVVSIERSAHTAQPLVLKTAGDEKAQRFTLTQTLVLGKGVERVSDVVGELRGDDSRHGEERTRG